LHCIYNIITLSEVFVSNTREPRVQAVVGEGCCDVHTETHHLKITSGWFAGSRCKLLPETTQI